MSGVPNLTQQESEELVQSLVLEEYSSLVKETVVLCQTDIAMLDASGPHHSQPQVQHIRAYHHMVALRLALAERPFQICAALGITPQTITKLQASPQFAELVEHYRNQVVEKAINHVELMSAVSAEALMALHEKLCSNERNDLPVETLRRLAETFVDRIGHSPVRRSETNNVHRLEINDEQLERLKKLHPEAQRWNGPAGGVTIDVTPHEEESLRAGAADSAVTVFKSVSRKEEAPPDSDSGKGNLV